jgi:hypothetical protein
MKNLPLSALGRGLRGGLESDISILNTEEPYPLSLDGFRVEDDLNIKTNLVNH